MRLIPFVFVVLFCTFHGALSEVEDVEEATVVEDEGPAEVLEPVEEIVYVSPTPVGHIYFAEHFDMPEEFEARWVRSQAKKDDIDEEIAKYDGITILKSCQKYCLDKLCWSPLGKWAIEGLMKDALKGDLGLVLKSKAKHAAIAAPLDRPFHFTNKPLIVQYDVTFQNGQECGGAYLKLLTQETGMRLSQFRDKTPYSIMFGPDKCGNDHKVGPSEILFQYELAARFSLFDRWNRYLSS